MFMGAHQGLKGVIAALLPASSRRGTCVRFLYRFVRERDSSLFRSIPLFGRIDVSVVVPIYNAEPYMRRCLDSLKRQWGGVSRIPLCK